MFRFMGNPHPALFMILAVVFHSTGPVLFKIGGAEDSPIMFTGIWQFGVGMGLGVAILLMKRKFLIRPAVIKDITYYSKSGLMLASIIGVCGYALFAWGLAFLDVSTAAILHEIWPLFLMLLTAYLFRGSKRYDPISSVTLIFVVLAILGAALVVLSQSDSPMPLLAIGANFSDFKALLGVPIVLAAAVCAAARVAYTLKLGTLLAERRPSTENHKEAEIVFTVVMASICHVIGGCVLFLIGMIASESISSHQLFYAIMGGFIVAPIGSIAFRIANLKTKDLGVNAIAYVTPLVALTWLWMFSVLDVPHLDYLIIGAMGIAASNVLINVKASERVAYKALMVSLWVFGTVIYFTEGYPTDVPLELTVTIFILVLAFRVDRLVRRTSQEEEWVFEVFHKLESRASKEQETSKEASRALLEAAKALIRIDKHKTTEALKAAYEDTVRHLRNARTDGIAKDEITEIRRLVDNLVHSRQQGSHFGEFVAIALTGGLIVMGLLVFNGSSEIYGEITSFLLSSVVVFLLFNIVDLQRDRRDETLIKGDAGEYIVNLDHARNRETQQLILMATSGVIVAVFVGLFFTGA